MEMSNVSPELHVAQQRRRDKLRVQQNAIAHQQLDSYTGNLEQFSAADQGLNPDFVQLQRCRYGNISYDPSPFSVSQALLAKDGNVYRESTTDQSDKGMIAAAAGASLTNLSCNFSATVGGDPQNCSTWKSIGSQQNYDWMCNYACGSAGFESNSSHMSIVDSKPGYLGNYHEIQTPLSDHPSAEISRQNSLRHYSNVHFNPVSPYQNTLQDVVTSATLGSPEVKMLSFSQQSMSEIPRGPWSDAGSELVLLPTFADQPSRVNSNCSSDLVSRPCMRSERCIGEFNHPANDSCSSQALSLSLSSVPPSRMHVDQVNITEQFQPSGGSSSAIHDSRTSKPDYFCSSPKQLIGDKISIISRQDMVGSPTHLNHRIVGPLGPFTGYATILRSSKFLIPAQQLLDEFCNVANPRPLRSCDTFNKTIQDADCYVGTSEPAALATMGDSGGSSSSFHSPMETSCKAGGLNSSNDSIPPEYLEKKAKLLYMQEEVSRRCKQYHQQMQMVVSSFESVAGLSAATPYISQALKTISRHFKCLKSAISDQLQHIRKALGEDFLSPTTGTNNSKGDTSTSRLKFIEHTIQKQKSAVGNAGFFEPQQHVWRPQRGLPERAVSILRAWLFDHFLHPYPTDSDKHMLATQTGLTRNQVSNWFINARVRVWKPMVEEIHMLETKGLSKSGTNAGKSNDEKSAAEGVRGSSDSKFRPNDQVEFLDILTSATAASMLNHDTWNQEKLSRMDSHTPANMDGSLIGFMPYHPSRIEMGGLRTVSLTLGLRQSAEAAQQQQHLQQPADRQIMQHFGGQIIHDFGG